MTPAARARLAYATALGAGVILLAMSGVLERRVGMIGSDDFSKIWAAPRALVTGHDLYDPLTWYRTAVDLGTFPPDTLVSLYPPWVALALAPLALLPLPAATSLWVVGGLAAAAAALRALLAACLPGRSLAWAAAGATLVVSGPAISTILTGQWSFVLLACVVATVLAMRSGNGTTGGIASLAMLAKPQLFLFFAPALALSALWPLPPHGRPRGGLRLVSVALAGSAALVAISWILMPSWWPAWPERISASQLTTESVTVPGLLIRTLGAPGLLLTPVVLLAAVGAGLLFHPRSHAWLAVWLALSLAATPYSNPYDLLLLIAALALGAGAMRTAHAGEILFLAGSGILLIVATLLHEEGLLRYAPLVPAAVFVLLVAALFPYRRALE